MNIITTKYFATSLGNFSTNCIIIVILAQNLFRFIYIYDFFDFMEENNINILELISVE
jgi:hypothetical protein